MEMDNVEVELKVEASGVARVILNRPDRKNAITGPLGVGLREAIEQASARDEVRVILLQGAGGSFCSGLDLKAFNADPAPAWLPGFQSIWRGAHRALYQCPKPIVGALERYAINGGAALALACDLLVVGETSFLQVGEVQIGMAAPYNMAWLSLRYSEATMARIALIGDRMSGADLVREGIATTIVPDSGTLDGALALAERLAEFPEGGLMRIKSGLRSRVEYSADEWFDKFTQANPVGSQPKPSSMKKVNKP